MISEVDQLIIRLSELEKQASELRTKRDKLNTEAREKADRRDELNKKMAELIAKVKEHQTSRDDENTKVQDFKVKREEVRKNLAEAKKEVDQIKETEELEPLPKPPVPEKVLRRNLKQLEWKIQTEILPTDEEKRLVQEIAILQEQLEEAEGFKTLRQERNARFSTYEGLKAEMNHFHKAVIRTAKSSQRHHHEMTKLFAEIDEIRKEADQCHKDFIETKKIADETHKKFIEIIKGKEKHQKSLHSIKQKARVDHFREVKETIEARAAKALEKYKNGKKLSLEEFSMLVERGLV
ncbi:MAG: coiled-coil protein [Candidatus Heimdallarchaeota archaeon]